MWGGDFSSWTPRQARIRGGGIQLQGGRQISQTSQTQKDSQPERLPVANNPMVQDHEGLCFLPHSLTHARTALSAEPWTLSA